MRSLFSFFTLILIISFTACGGDDVDCSDPNLNQVWADEFQAAVNAGAAYAQDPSSDNCKTYREAIKKYLDVIKDYEQCANTAEEQDDFRQAIEESEDEIDNLDCG